MKRLFFISVSVILVSFACQKEVITKNVNCRETEDVLPSARTISTSFDVVTLPGDNSGTNGGGITDPNNDPDLNKKKVNRN